MYKENDRVCVTVSIMEELVLTKKIKIRNAMRFEFYVPSVKLYINVSGKNEEEARRRALEILGQLMPSEQRS